MRLNDDKQGLSRKLNDVVKQSYKDEDEKKTEEIESLKKKGGGAL